MEKTENYENLEKISIDKMCAVKLKNKGNPRKKIKNTGVGLKNSGSG